MVAETISKDAREAPWEKIGEEELAAEIAEDVGEGVAEEVSEEVSEEVGKLERDSSAGSASVSSTIFIC